jgi:phosphomannomutase
MRRYDTAVVKVDPYIFKSYDIRGIYPNQLNGEVAYRVGRALADYLRDKGEPEEIFVGRDMRLSSEELFAAFSKGLIEQGFGVFDLGLTGTEVYYFAVGEYHKPGAMITASHNPPEYGGLKMIRTGVVALSGADGIPQLKEAVLKRAFKPKAERPGRVRSRDLHQAWRRKILSLVDLDLIKDKRIVVDAGNAMAGKLVPIIFEGLPVEIIPMFFELDGSFPNHIPDPLKAENVEPVRKRVLEEGADFGVAFDGDGDRFFVIDDTGKFVSGTLTTAMLAEVILAKYPGSLLLYNAVCGRIVPEVIEKLGGRSKRVRVGHSFIKNYMKEYGAVFAGEHSGHYFYRDYYRAESGLLSLLYIIEFLSRRGQKLSEVVKELDVYYQSGEINSEVKSREGKMNEIEKIYRDKYRIDRVDGVSVWGNGWWANVRPSGTEPLLRLNVEADNAALMQEKRDELLALIRS